MPNALRLTPYAFLLLFSITSHAQSTRFTSFDDRPICEDNKGVWREFGNGCVDECHSKFDKFSICTQAITYGCDCGKGRCWDGESCVTTKNYKKIFDAEKEEEKKILEAAKQKRLEQAKANEQSVIENLGKKITASVEAAQKNKETAAAEKAAAQAETEAPPIEIDTSKVQVPESFLKQEKAKIDAVKAKLDGVDKTKNNAPDTSSDPLALPVIPLPN